MKKLVAVLLVLAMMVAVTAAFAEAVGSKTAGDIAGIGGGKQNEGLTFVIVKTEELDEAIAAIETAIVESKELPEDVAKLVPADFLEGGELADHLKEMFAVIATGEIGDIESYILSMKLDTPYEDGTELCVLFGTPEGWLAKDATVKEGEVTVELVKADLEKMVNKGQVAVLVFNK